MKFFAKIKSFFQADWLLLLSVIPLISVGLFTMHSFTEKNDLLLKQLIWLVFSIVIFFILSNINFRFLRKTRTVVTIFSITVFVLILLLFVGKTIKGSTSWFSFGSFSFQPSDFAKLTLIILLSKYFSKRHIEIKNIRHIIVSGMYSLVLFFLVMLQPDLGSGIIIFSIWFGMVLVSGISKKHLAVVISIGLICFISLWVFVFKDYQKQRIMTFIDPMSDVRGAGYNAHQSVVAVGSGGILGKGIGFGTQSRLNYLPEYETDFIFAAFAEEWGLVGVLFLFIAFSILVIRILYCSIRGETNFETLFAVGVVTMFISHFIINVGMNMGLMPVTGIPLPFVSYGGSHLLSSFVGLGIISGMNKYSRVAHRDVMKNEFIGI